MAGINILHIAQDEKFINAAYYLFERAFPEKNRFIIVKPPANPPVRFVNKNLNLDYEVTNASIVDRLVEQCGQYAVTVFHGLDRMKGEVFLRSEDKSRFMTIIYGGEIYNSGLVGVELMGPKTRQLQDTIKWRTPLEVAKDIYRSIAYRKSGDFKSVDFTEVLYKMQTFGSLPGFSYKTYIDNQIYNPSVRQVPFTYYPLEFIVKNDVLRASGQNILFGNSASPTNNHLEGFDLLKKLDLSDRSIVTPLSYGYPRYRKAILSHGKKLFQNNFKPLTSFLPLEEYNQIVSRCGIVIMNHYRPQAVGNIIASLFMGAKVFMNNTEAYQYFKQLGCNIYLIEDDLIVQDEREVFKLLTEEQVEHNRMVLKNKLSTEVLAEGMRRSFAEFFDFNISEKREPIFI